MAKLFSTRFMLDSNSSLDDFMDLGKIWVAKSPHTILKPEDIKDLKEHGEKVEREGYIFEIGRVKQNDVEIAGISYIHPGERNDIWNTKVVAYKNKDILEALLVVDYESPKIKLQLPSCKKPFLVKLLLDRIGGGRDGDLVVKSKPNYIKEDSGDEFFISGILNGSAESIMPVVYVSKDDNNVCLVDPDDLAYSLSGVAHVLVEPSKQFSFKLKDQTGSKNVFGGAVGVYWSDGYSRFFWLPEDIRSKKDPINAIFCKVVELLNSRKVPKEFTWENIQSIHNLQKIEKMKNDHKNDVDSVLDTYISQLELTARQLKESEERESRLEKELRTARFSKPITGGLVPDVQITQIYNGEVKQIVSDALNTAKNQVHKNSRRSKILGELVSKMYCKPEARDEMTEKIKKLFNDYTRMSGPIRSELESTGFLLLDDGPHYKLVLASDLNGLSVAIPKTPSDHRSGKNTAAEIIRAFF